jgi:hypothetical protein
MAYLNTCVRCQANFQGIGGVCPSCKQLELLEQQNRILEQNSHKSETSELSIDPLYILIIVAVAASAAGGLLYAIIGYDSPVARSLVLFAGAIGGYYAFKFRATIYRILVTILMLVILLTITFIVISILKMIIFQNS